MAKNETQLKKRGLQRIKKRTKKRENKKKKKNK